MPVNLQRVVMTPGSNSSALWALCDTLLLLSVKHFTRSHTRTRRWKSSGRFVTSCSTWWSCAKSCCHRRWPASASTTSKRKSSPRSTGAISAYARIITRKFMSLWWFSFIRVWLLFRWFWFQLWFGWVAPSTHAYGISLLDPQTYESIWWWCFHSSTLLCPGSTKNNDS